MLKKINKFPRVTLKTISDFFKDLNLRITSIMSIKPNKINQFNKYDFE